MYYKPDTTYIRRQGFTLIELLIVIAIIALLATLVAPNIFRNVSDARVATARSQIDMLGLAIAQYHLDIGSPPTTAQGLEALRSPQPEQGVPGGTAARWRGPYLSRPVPKDPWGRDYVYTYPGIANPATYDLYSLGRDGLPGGDGEDADISAWGDEVDAPAGAGYQPRFQ